jgi:stress response protein YsnF
VVETGRVRVRTVVDEKLARVSEELERDDVTIERVPINKEVTEVPPIREEEGVLIVPLLEEVVVVEKRLMLKEELRVTRMRKRERVEQAVQVRTMDADVRRVHSTPRSDAAPEHAAEGVRMKPRLRRKEPLTSRRK